MGGMRQRIPGSHTPPVSQAHGHRTAGGGWVGSQANQEGVWPPRVGGWEKTEKLPKREEMQTKVEMRFN